jgi:hypothetical protein
MVTKASADSLGHYGQLDWERLIGRQAQSLKRPRDRSIPMTEVSFRHCGGRGRLGAAPVFSPGKCRHLGGIRNSGQENAAKVKMKHPLSTHTTKLNTSNGHRIMCTKIKRLPSLKCRIVTEMGNVRQNMAIARFPDTKKRPNVLTPKTKSAAPGRAGAGRGDFPCQVRQAMSDANNPKSTNTPAPCHCCGLFNTAKVVTSYQNHL